MLKQFVAAFMMLIFMMQTFSNAIIVTNYYINTKSFAVNCENKDKPQLHCNGQCQMVKQLEKEDRGSKPFSNTSKEKSEIQLFSIDNLNTDTVLSSSLSTFNTDPNHFCMQQHIRIFFHPPSAV